MDMLRERMIRVDRGVVLSLILEPKCTFNC